MPNRARSFWQRISDGDTLQQLWSQLSVEARASYRPYSAEVDWARLPDEKRRRRARRVISGLFWAVVMKPSPARRVGALCACDREPKGVLKEDVLILITGATGHVGRGVANILSERNVRLRLMGRDLSRLPQIGAECVTAEYDDPQSLEHALEGIERAFIVSGYAEPGKRSTLHKNAFDAAAKAGVRHLVYLSFLSASPSSLFPMGRDHSWSEEHLRATGVPFTSLRDSFYMDLIPEMFNDKGIMLGPAGDGRVSWVAREDVIRVVASVLENPVGKEGIFDITGPESLTLQETAEQMSLLTGDELRYENESVQAGRAWRSQLGALAWEVETWLGSYEAIAAGELAKVSDAVRNLTGTASSNLRSYFSLRPALIEGLQKKASDR